MNVQYIRLSMTPSGVPPVIYMSQYDVGRPIGFICDEDLDSYAVTLEATRTDGTAITVAVTTDGNIGVFTTTATMTNVADEYPAQVVITDSSSNRVASIPVRCIVIEAAMDEDAESIEEDASLYQQYTGTVRALVASEAVTRANNDATLADKISALQAAVGSPLTASTASAMTDTSKIYVYTGSESGYTNGNWYYYNGSSWVSGGTYNSTALETDDTLSVADMAADAEVTGWRTEEVNSDIKSMVDTGKGLLSRGNFGNDVYSPSTGVVGTTWPYRISARTGITFPYAITLVIADGFKIVPYLYISGAWTSQGWKTGSYFVPENTEFYIQIARVTENTSETADIDEFLSAVTVEGSPFEVAVDAATQMSVVNQNLIWEQGAWTYSNPYIVKSESPVRIRSRELLPVPHSVKVYTKQAGVRVAFFFTDTDGVYQSAYSEYVNASDVPQYVSFNFDAKFGDNIGSYRMAVTVLFTTLQAVPSNVDDYAVVSFLSDPIVKNGKQVLIYPFGGQGNDWCWVRTPTNYNQHRVKPYPFVICNHGNGWTMNGKAQYANWTKRTMYVPLDDEDYIANPTQYNGTSDETLWYSNPTIEALLAAGYIVCGCENYGDGLYGNENCRNACVDFFYHMIKTYNVEGHCYMIGASSGALTSLNAAYLLPGRIKAMILQYPITCLVNQYTYHADHRAGIRDAYGIEDTSITTDELTAAVATHDPYTTDVVSGVKVGPIPPIKIYYSPDDTVAEAQYNAIPFAALLTNSNKIVETVEVSGAHGDYSHFAPQAFVAWFSAHQ